MMMMKEMTMTKITFMKTKMPVMTKWILMMNTIHSMKWTLISSVVSFFFFSYVYYCVTLFIF